MIDLEPVSLLWPTKESKRAYMNSEKAWDEAFIKNLGADQIVRDICLQEKYLNEMKNLVCYLCDDPDVIQYRLDIMEDFIRLPGLGERLEKLLPTIQKLEEDKIDLYSLGAHQVRKIAWQLERLYIYVECMEELAAIVNYYEREIQSEGLLKLCTFVKETTKDEHYQSLKIEIPKFKQQLESMSFVTIGINLDSSLKPVEAILLSVESKPYKKPSFLSNFLGLSSAEDTFLGNSQFQRIVHSANLESALFRDLEEVFAATLQPIAVAIRQYNNIHNRVLSTWAFEWSFYIGAAKWIRQHRNAGLSMCKPKVLPKEERECHITNLRDMILAMNWVQTPGGTLDEKIVPNDVDFGPKGRIFILTGPNQGGKTTYTRAIGLAQLLFQAGLYIPATSASMSPVDWICTHFNEEETPDVRFGRLGEESERLAKVFDRATPYSLILLNESFSSTSPGEGLYLAEDIVRGLILIGCRTVFATHFHELARNIEALNSEFPDSDTKLISMVAGVERSETGGIKHKRTYKVVPSPPQGLSYAQDIARLYGISLEQITEKLRNRGIL